MICALACAWSTLPAVAQTPAASALEYQQMQRQQERSRALREQLEATPRVIRPQEERPTLEIPASETPCFPVHTLRVEGRMVDAVPWLVEAADLRLHEHPVCLGIQGIEVVIARMQQSLVERGLITSRVTVREQNLSKGSLTVTFIPGTVHALRLDDAASAKTSILAAIPVSLGGLLQLRDIEQGLENLKRIPSADANIEIAPSAAENAPEGSSDLIIKYRKSRPVRLQASMDNAGLQATGKYLGTLIAFWDNPLSLNDLLYVGVTSDIENAKGKGTRTTIAHYSIPYGYWNIGLSASRNQFHQTIAGDQSHFRYGGTENQTEIRVSRTVFRNATARSGVGLRLFRRDSSAYLDDTAIEVQRRITAGYELSAVHQHSFQNNATLNAGLSWRRGTGMWGAMAAPEEASGEGSSRMQVLLADVGYARQFEWWGRRSRVSTALHAQWNGTALTPQDRIAIGGRFTVRGLDGEANLAGDRGFYQRNELAMALGGSAEGFVGVDFGRVGGQSSAALAGKSLSGMAVGVRGSLVGAGYELFVGTPLHQPDGFKSASATFGFNVSYSF